jgi:hypothetical protein
MGGASSQVIWRQRYDADADSVLRRALATLQCEVHELSSQQWDAGTASIGGVRDYQCSYFAPAAAEWSSLLLHLDALIGEQLAAELSRLTSAPAISFAEYDQTAWGYTLFLGGVASDRFWSVPEVVDEEPAAVRGMPSVLSAAFSVLESDVAPYLQHLSPAPSEASKAFPDDEFELGDHWVRVDFMRRLGLRYPDPGKTPGGRYLQVVESHTPIVPSQEKATLAPPKPRWKFWR